jgi:hypothetical protein
VTACVYWERLRQIRNKESTLDELCYILAQLAKSPAYLRLDGRPVVFLTQRVCQSLPPEEWAWVLNEASRKVAPGLVAIGQSFTQADVLLWDGALEVGAFYRLADGGAAGVPSWWRQTYDLPTALAKRAHQVSIVTVCPGYDDRKANTLANSTIATLVDRQDGRLYTALWEQALASGADWVVVNSFNQWHNGTEIEPSVELGEKYLKVTQEYAARLKAPGVAAGTNR